MAFRYATVADMPPPLLILVFVTEVQIKKKSEANRYVLQSDDTISLSLCQKRHDRAQLLRQEVWDGSALLIGNYMVLSSVTPG